jgi:hypothetical protein
MPDDLAPQHDAPLTPSEQQQLSELETTIEKGMQTFLEVGAALAAVRDGRLYRADYGTFEAYCQERWGMTRRNANHLIGAVDVVDSLGTTVPKPTSERQARALGKVPEAERAEVWQEAHERSGGKPTAKLIEQLARERTQKPTPPQGEPEFDPSPVSVALDEQFEEPYPPAAPHATPAAQGAAIVPEPDTAPALTPEPAQQPVHAGALGKLPNVQTTRATPEPAQQPVHNATPLEVVELQATIARLQGKVASLEGKNEQLQEQLDTARNEYNRAAAKLAKAPDAQELERLRSDNAWAHQRYAELKQCLDQAAPLREQARQRAAAMPKSPLSHHIKKLLQLVDDLAGLLP